MDQTKHYFNAYPLSNECYETSDRLLFHKRSDAEAHAATLANSSVLAYQRTKKSISLKASKIVNAIQASETLNALKSALPEGETRKSVLAAYNKKQQSLQAAEQLVD